MTTRSEVERALDTYLAQGAEQVADRVVDAALYRIEHTPQRRQSWAPWNRIGNDVANRVALTAVGVIAAVVLSVGVYAALAAALNLEGPGTGAATSVQLNAIEMAEAYIVARNAHDPESARQLITEDFTTTEDPDGFRDARNLELAFAFHEAFEMRYADTACEEFEPARASASETTVVLCTAKWTNALQSIALHPPADAEFSFQIRDGLIASVVYGDNSTFYAVWYDEFLLEHREFRHLMTQAHVLDPEATQQMIDQLPEYLELFEEWMTDHG